jgi:hypothetical protein
MAQGGKPFKNGRHLPALSHGSNDVAREYRCGCSVCPVEWPGGKGHWIARTGDSRAGSDLLTMTWSRRLTVVSTR